MALRMDGPWRTGALGCLGGLREVQVHPIPVTILVLTSLASLHTKERSGQTTSPCLEGLLHHHLLPPLRLKGNPITQSIGIG